MANRLLEPCASPMGSRNHSSEFLRLHFYFYFPLYYTRYYYISSSSSSSSGANNPTTENSIVTKPAEPMEETGGC